MKRPHHSESGSAFFIILVGIAMFASLSYIVFKGGNVSESTLTSDRAKIIAQEIISYGDAISKAVQRLRLQGCTENQISFDAHNGLSRQTGGTAYSYANAQAPTDGSCDVFSANGGKVIPSLISSGNIDPALVSSTWMHPQSFVIIPGSVTGVGTTDATASSTDLLLWVGRLQPQVCVEINKILGIDYDTVPVDSLCGSGVWDGTFPVCGDPIGNTATKLAGKTAFCSQDTAGDATQVHFRQVLLAR